MLLPRKDIHTPILAFGERKKDPLSQALWTKLEAAIKEPASPLRITLPGRGITMKTLTVITTARCLSTFIGA